MARLFVVSALYGAQAFVPSSRLPRCGPLSVFKEPTDPDAMYKEPARRPKKLRPKDPSLYMEPVPLVPDAEGSWEPLVAEIWPAIEEMSKLAETNFKAELSRFREFCDHYRTQRGTLEGASGRRLSAQTRLFGADADAPPLPPAADHKWTRKLAKRVVGPILEEYDAAVAQRSSRNGTWATRTQLAWSRDQIMAVRAEEWDAPPTAADEDDDDAAAAAANEDPKAGLDEAAKDALAAEEEMAGGDPVPTAAGAAIEPAAEEAAPAAPEAAAPPVPDVPLEPAWEQLLLQQVTPLKTGVLRFPRAMKALSKYEATAPPPRNVILGKLPPGCATAPRSDLQNFVLTLQIPLRGTDGAGVIVAGEKVPYVENKPVVFDSTYEYSMYNDGTDDALVLHVDFWHPDVTVDEKQMLAYFWMLWQFDQYHPSTRARYTRRINYRKEEERKALEARRKAIKKSDKKDGGGGGGSIARK